MSHVALEKVAANVTRLSTSRGIVWFSYGIPIALAVGGRAVRCKWRYPSVTTSRHLTRYCSAYEEVETGEFDLLLAEVC